MLLTLYENMQQETTCPGFYFAALLWLIFEKQDNLRRRKSAQVLSTSAFSWDWHYKASIYEVDLMLS